MTNPAAETKSMGLPADTHAVMVFAGLSRQIIFNSAIPALSRDYAKTHASPKQTTTTYTAKTLCTTKKTL
jgi:hypothetical protein